MIAEGMAERWLQHTCNVSLQVCLLVLFVGVLSLACRKASSSFRYGLWCVVLVRLCLPFTVAGPAGMAPELRAPIEHAASALSRDDADAANRASAVFSRDAASDDPSSAVGLASDAQGHRRIAVASRALLAAWLGVVLLLMTLVAQRAWRFHRRLGSCALVDRSELLDLALRLRADLRIRRSVGVHVHDWPGIGPFTVGVVCPRILLPRQIAEGWPVQDLKPILAHELAHIKRLDTVANWAQVLAQAVFFFHPLAWYAHARIRKLREEACDDLAIHHLGGERTQYARSFVRVLEGMHQVRSLVHPALGIVETKSSLTGRVTRIMNTNYSRHSRLTWKTVTALALMGAAAIALAGERPQKAAPAERQGALDKAEQLYKDKKYTEAITAYENLAATYPDWDYAEHSLMMIGICYDWMGEDQKAVAAFERTVKQFPSLQGFSEATWYYLGEAYQKAGRRDDALAAFTNCIDLCQDKRDPNKFPYREAVKAVTALQGRPRMQQTAAPAAPAEPKGIAGDKAGFAKALEKPVTVNVDTSGYPGSERLSLQYAAIAICKAAGVPYQWEKSQEQAGDICRRFIPPLKVDNLPAKQALTDLLTPLGVAYSVDDGGVHLHKK